MVTAGEWVRRMIAQAGQEPLSSQDVWKSLEKYAGQGQQALQRVRDVLDYIDRQMIERHDGPVMRGLWAAVTDYLERVQEEQAAA